MKIFILIVIIFSGIQLRAQDAKNTIVLSGLFAHYDQISKYRSAKVTPGYYQYPVDPGIEILYLRNQNNNISLGTGICLQKGKIMDFIINRKRFHFTEVSFPVLLSSRFKLDERNGLLFATGLYAGKTILLKAESEGKLGGWYKSPDFDISWYSNDAFFMDIYFGAGYTYSFSQNRIISMEPFVKYRVNTVWLNSFQKKLHYGVKLSYSVNL